MKYKKLMLLCAIGVLVFTGCNKKEEVKDSSQEKATQEVKEEPQELAPEEEVVVEENTNADMAVSYLTGLEVPKEQALRRPVAIMLSNIKGAVPQSGIENASVVYEAPVEGGITRLMGIFEDYDALTKIGSVRSCRTYYVFYAMEFDAIYAHYGQAAYAIPYLEREWVDNLSGLDGYGDKVYYRTTDRKAPHNAYTSAEGIQKGIEICNYPKEYDSDYKGHYKFAGKGEQVDLADGVVANKVTIPYVTNTPWFEYNSEDHLYYRFQYGGKQIDDITNNQLAYSNIILQYSDYTYYEDSQYLNIDTQSGGKGKFITNGKAIDITWKKESEWGKTQYFDANGNEITLNPGKTWVCIVQNDMADSVEIG